ncbi:MAG: hypothetical protein H6905_09625 [Hyphomicrobiales bacterium]|nr:hypothetical protein [Hyphomicrobiales bacterium]
MTPKWKPDMNEVWEAHPDVREGWKVLNCFIGADTCDGGEWYGTVLWMADRLDVEMTKLHQAWKLPNEGKPLNPCSTTQSELAAES